MAFDDLIEGILDAIWPTKPNSTVARWVWRILWIGVLAVFAYAAYLIYRFQLI